MSNHTMSSNANITTPAHGTPSSKASLVELWVAMTNHRTGPEHWVLLLRPYVARICTRYQSTGRLRNYSLKTEAAKRFIRRNFPNLTLIAVVDKKHVPEI
ncbi:hypothetical protein BDW74DRAFT_175668 [Aspergillus multicolor]|uniref:uncharacterized protein n=1 Tax=Aspergillus multicolor TaxID=41759 RepID=UPI003CCCE2BE